MFFVDFLISVKLKYLILYRNKLLLDALLYCKLYTVEHPVYSPVNPLATEIDSNA